MTVAVDAADELAALRQWVLWRRDPPIPPSTTPRKVPYRADGAGRAATDRPEGWASFEEALSAFDTTRDAGLGFVFTAADPYVGVDLDHCRDAETGAIEPWALDVIARLDSYTEASPSGTGVHIILRGTLPAGRRKKARAEAYAAGRYFTFTGQHLADTPSSINERSAELAAFHAEYLADTAPSREDQRRADSTSLDDTALLERMFASAQGPKLVRLWAGDTSEFAEDESAADLSLCDALAWWTNGDAARMDRLFRVSGLMRSKWDERRGAHTYGARTIDTALKGISGGYSGRTNGTAPTPHLSDNVPITAAEILGPSITTRWPSPPDERVYHGVAGDFVRLIAPHTEADPMALLMQFLVAYGNVIGRSAHFVAEADRHYANLFTCLVGETAKGRKGSSWGQVKRVMAVVAPGWASGRIQEGQSSGEGLIWAVRDPIQKTVAVTNKGKATGEYRTEVVDEGIDDKRLLAAESEFASLLRVLEREGNTLSAVLRQAWDSGTLRALTKNSQARSSGAHISEIGHITADELHRYLLRTEVANGLGNRFLWTCVRRSKVLPDGGNIAAVNFTPFIDELQTAIDFGGSRGEMVRDSAARAYWHEIYPALSEGEPGMAGALLARAEAQVMRIAMVFALLDLSPQIGLAHLEAAMCVWQYCDASVRAIFGAAVGDPIADTILAALQDAPEGMNRTQVYKLFHGNQAGEALTRALAMLESKGLVESVKQATGGRPTEIIRLGRGTQKEGRSEQG